MLWHWKFVLRWLFSKRYVSKFKIRYTLYSLHQNSALWCNCFHSAHTTELFCKPLVLKLFLWQQCSQIFEQWTKFCANLEKGLFCFRVYASYYHVEMNFEVSRCRCAKADAQIKVRIVYSVRLTGVIIIIIIMPDTKTKTSNILPKSG